jgi:beta-D-xylosidase 4
MQRDPRWGRNQEVPGEDPYLTSQYSKAFVEALQGTNDDSNSSSSSSSSSKLRLGACCKHFLANSLERWGNYSRHNFNAQIDQEDLYNYYLPPFEECVKSKAAGVMCSYNAVNGAPSCANPWLLKQVLREKWNFTG